MTEGATAVALLWSPNYLIWTADFAGRLSALGRRRFRRSFKTPRAMPLSSA
jgi:hypothetical protein